SLDHLGRYGSISQVSIPTPVGCQSTPAPPSGLAENTDKSIGESNSRAYRCGDGVFVLTLHTYPARIGSRPVFASLRPAVTEPGLENSVTESQDIGAGAAAQRWSKTEISHSGHYTIVASAVWIDGRPASGLAGRLRQAVNSFRRSPVPPVTVVITYTTSARPDDARRAMDSFLVEAIGLSDSIGHSSRAAG